MYRQQLSLVFVLVAATSISALGASPAGSASGLALFPDDGSSATLSGTLQHNASDLNGIAPYMLVDRWGVVRGYVTAKPGLELEPYLGHQITVRGAMRRLSAGDMPLLTAEKLDQADRSVAAASYMAGASRGQSPAVRQVEHQEAVPTPAPQRPLGTAPADGMPAMGLPQPSPDVFADPGMGYAPGPASPGRLMEMPAGPPAGAPCCGEGGCSVGGECGECGEECGPCGTCGPRMRRGPVGLWVNVDYLMWAMRGMHVPQLVTTGPGPDPTQPTTPPTAANSGGPGEPSTTILFGDENINDRIRSGGRLQFGWWLDCCQTVGIEGEYFGLAQDSTHYRLWSDGNPVVSRPFFDSSTTPPNQPSIESVAAPRTNAASIDGAINVDSFSRLEGAAARLRFALCHADACWNDCGCGGRTYHDSYCSFFTLGYRFLRLDDRLGVTEQLTSTVTGAQGAFLIEDNFATTNQFNGCELGLQFDWRRNAWSFGVTPRISFGSTYENGLVDGFTRTTNPNGTRTLASGGLLTKSTTNIGAHAQEVFSVVPEVTLTLGYQVTSHTRATLGYNFLAWSDVVRAGDQIDLHTTAPGNPAVAPHPEYPFQTTSFWAQGLNFGLDFRW